MEIMPRLSTIVLAFESAPLIRRKWDVSEVNRRDIRLRYASVRHASFIPKASTGTVAARLSVH
jgi:hypothetical protein